MTTRNAPISIRLPFLLTLLLAGALAVACGDAPPPGGGRDGPVKVLATTGIVGDLAARIAGEDAAVESLMGPGIDPHLYKASQSDVRRMADADLVLYNGLHLEGKMGDVLVKMARNRPVVAVTDDIPRDRLREPPEFAGQYDPHVWFDVSLWARTVEPVVRELEELDPAHAAGYRERGEALRRELEELDAWVLERIRELPEERRVLVTAHDAFGYFGRRYGLEVHGIQGISTLSEAGLRDVEGVVELLVEREVPAVFFESSVPRRSIETVVEAARRQGHQVRLGGELFSDSMGREGTEEGTYPGMVRHNVNTLVDALTP